MMTCFFVSNSGFTTVIRMEIMMMERFFCGWKLVLTFFHPSCFSLVFLLRVFSFSLFWFFLFSGFFILTLQTGLDFFFHPDTASWFFLSFSSFFFFSSISSAFATFAPFSLLMRESKSLLLFLLFLFLIFFYIFFLLLLLSPFHSDSSSLIPCCFYSPLLFSLLLLFTLLFFTILLLLPCHHHHLFLHPFCPPRISSSITSPSSFYRPLGPQLAKLSIKI